MQWVPTPKSFLHFMSLQTGAELICIFTVFNKVSGIYGILALITGAAISWAQMSMYIYSILAAIVFAYSLRHIKAGPPSALQVIAFAWFYVLDTCINLAYTALFATSWFLVLSQQGGSSTSDAMKENAGVVSPTHTISSVNVVPTLINGRPSTEFATTPSASVPALGESVLHPEQIPSILALIAILLIKVYFILVVLSYARTLVAQVESSSMAKYTGWQAKAYAWMTRGSYWSRAQDLRLSKSRSTRRSDEVRR